MPRGLGALTPCRHCGVEFRAARLSSHEAKCPASPAVRAAIRAALTDPADPARAVPRAAYAEARLTTGAPSHSLLLNRYGSWTAAAAAFGLKPPAAVRPTAACPHCQMAVAVNTLKTHAAACPERPGVQARLYEAVARPEVPGAAITETEYRERYERGELDPALPSPYSLLAHFGAWGGVCAWLGLRPARDEELRAAQELAQAAADQERVRAIMRQERGPRGLEVCRVRELPDGRVACMVR